MKKNKSDWFFRKEKLMKLSQIMRLTILMMVCLNLTLSAEVYSQAEKFSIRKTNATVKEVFEEVMQRTSYHFFYNNEFDVNRKVSIDMKNGDIDAVVRKVLEGQDYSYRLIDNYIIIKRESQQAEPQSQHTRKISGIVKDKEGMPLPGVSVALAGTTLGVATDVDGKFTFVVPGPGSILKFSFIGKKSYEVVVQDETYFDVTLQDDEKMLEEVVCTGIQTISRERATGSFEFLSNEALDRTLTSDVVSRLQGKVAGVQVDQNNKMTIRGRGSILSNTEPLVVVDGFPVEGGLESVNPDDIANITILKDAAAASIWGVRAGNGVVVITTKSGQNGQKATLDVSYFLTVKQKSNLKDLHLLNAEQSLDLQLEQILTNNWAPYYNFIGLPKDMGTNRFQDIYTEAWMKYVDWNDEYDFMESHYDEVMNDSEFQQKLAQLKKADLMKQFKKHLMRNAIGNRLNVSLRGGTDRSDYYLSAVYDHQLLEGVGDKSNDMLFNLKHNYKLSNRLTLSSSVNVRYNNAENNSIAVSELIGESPFHALLDEKGNRLQYYMIDREAAQEAEAQGYMSYTKNMLDDQELNDNTSDVFSARLHAALKLNIIEGMDIETRFQYERGYGKNENMIAQSHSSMRRLINNYTLVNDDGSFNYQIPKGNKYETSRNDFEAWTWRNQLSYNKGWNDTKHLLAAVLGHELRMYKTKSHSQVLYGYDPVSLTYAPFDEAIWMNEKITPWFGEGIYAESHEPFNNYTETDNRDLSLYLNAAYTYNTKYTLSVSGRIDQSNLFGNDSDYKYNFIWSSGLSWRISKEEFAKVDWMDQLLVRLTYGIGGNVNKNFYPVLMGSKSIDIYGSTIITLDNPANKDLKWEKTTTFNAGVDFSFLSDRIGGSFDYYHKKSTDLLGRVSLDPTNGFKDATMNFASMLNQGFELSLNLVPVQTKDFTWNVGFNISYNQNEVTKVDVAGSAEADYLQNSPASGGLGVAVKGKPINRLYAYNYAGLNNTGEIMLWENGEKIHYSEYTRATESLVYMGTTEAPWYGGLSTSFEYKGITLSANATYKFGHKFRQPVADPSEGTYNNIADRWRKEGDEEHTMVPGLQDPFSSSSFDYAEYYRMANVNVHDAAYLRLNEISLAYHLPRPLLTKTPFQSIDIQFQVRNACLWTKNKLDIDPESIEPDYYGASTYTLSEPRSFILGIKATF